MQESKKARVQQTRERIRGAAHELFLKLGYQATSIDAILYEAGLSSKETFYRYYSGKEALFIDVLSHLTVEQPGFSEKLAALPSPRDLPALRSALRQLSHEILAMMYQPGYFPLVRMIIAESSRFPQLGTLFFSTVTARGLAIINSLLQAARDQQFIADIDFEAVTHLLLGGLLSYAFLDLVVAGEQGQLPPLERADALIEVIMRALTP